MGLDFTAESIMRSIGAVLPGEAVSLEGLTNANSIGLSVAYSSSAYVTENKTDLTTSLSKMKALNGRVSPRTVEIILNDQIKNKLVSGKICLSIDNFDDFKRILNRRDEVGSPTFHTTFVSGKLEVVIGYRVMLSSKEIKVFEINGKHNGKEILESAKYSIINQTNEKYIIRY